MSFIPVLLICVFAALLFAAGAFFTAFKAGVTLVPGAEHDSALVIGYKGFSLTAGNALVALIVCSFFCMTVVPVTLLYLNYKVEQSDETLNLQLNFTPSVPLTVRSLDDVEGTNDPQLRIFKSSHLQRFQIMYPGYSTVVVDAGYDWANRKPFATVNKQPVDVVTVGADARVVTPFSLSPETVAAKATVPATLSALASVPASQAVKPDPPGLAVP
jgi:hypothetical protein